MFRQFLNCVTPHKEADFTGIFCLFLVWGWISALAMTWRCKSCTSKCVRRRFNMSTVVSDFISRDSSVCRPFVSRKRMFVRTSLTDTGRHSKVSQWMQPDSQNMSKKVAVFSLPDQPPMRQLEIVKTEGFIHDSGKCIGWFRLKPLSHKTNTFFYQKIMWISRKTSLSFCSCDAVELCVVPGVNCMCVFLLVNPS